MCRQELRSADRNFERSADRNFDLKCRQELGRADRIV